VQFQVDTAQLDQAVAHLSAAGVRSLTSQPPTLEELFLRHYQTGEGERR
jgi:ABC-2 type transport system ATP-binding protein